MPYIYVTAILLVIIIIGEDPGTVCCGWTRGWVIKNQPENMADTGLV